MDCTGYTDYLDFLVDYMWYTEYKNYLHNIDYMDYGLRISFTSFLGKGVRAKGRGPEPEGDKSGRGSYAGAGPY